MPWKRQFSILSILAALVLVVGFQSAEAGISKTSLRTIRNSDLPWIKDFTAVAVSSTSVRWNWTASTATAVTGYLLYTSSASSSAPKVLTKSTSYYVDKNLDPNKQYTRWITTYSGDPSTGQESSDSDHYEKYTYGVPPTAFHFDVITASCAVLSWYRSQATAYAVEISTDKGAHYGLVNTYFGPLETVPVIPNRFFMMRMGAVNGDNERTPGMYSAVQIATAPPFTPNFQAVATSSGTIRWSWDAATFAGSGITGYDIYASTIAAEGEIPANVDIGEVLYSTDNVNASSWTEVYASTPSDNKAHVRWIIAKGVIDSFGKPVVRRFTYAVAPSTCGILDPVRDIRATSLKLSWPDSGANRYMIVGSSTGVIDDHSYREAFDGNSANLGKLPDDARLDICVGAINGDDVQTPENLSYGLSALYKVRTRPLPPTNVVSSPVSFSAIRYQWSTAAYQNSTSVDGYDICEQRFDPQHNENLWYSVAYVSGKSVSSYDLDYMLTNSTHTRSVSAHQTDPEYATFGSDVSTGSLSCTFATPPADVTIATVTSRTVGLYWQEPMVPATEYRVERSTVPREQGPWVFVSTATGSYFTDTGLDSATTYYYRVGAINKMGIQTTGMYAYYDGNARDYSFVRSIKTLEPPPQFYGVALSTRSVSWNWSTSAGNVSSFTIYTSTDGVLKSGITPSTTFWVEVSTVGANTPLTRRISFTTPNGTSEKGETVCYTQALAPTGLAVSGSGLHTMTMSWSGPYCSFFRISRSPDRLNWTTVKDYADRHSLTNFTDTFLQLNTTYYYAVTGLNGDGIPTASSTTSSGFRTQNLPSSTVLMVTTATVAQVQTVQLAAGGQLSISIPAGALSQTGYVSVNVDPRSTSVDFTRAEIDDALSRYAPNIPLKPWMVEIFYKNLNGVTQTGSFNTPVTLTYTYPDSNDDEIIDGSVPPIRIGTIKVTNLRRSDLSWVTVPGMHIDLARRTISVPVSHFSMYMPGSTVPLKPSLDSLLVYPNPYKPGSGGDFDNSLLGEGIVFENLTTNSTVRIFTLAGELVAELTEGTGTGRAVWNARNRDGARVASGMYFYLVTDGNGSKKVSGKVTIIK